MKANPGAVSALQLSWAKASEFLKLTKLMIGKFPGTGMESETVRLPNEPRRFS